MDSGAAAQTMIDKLLPECLQRLQQVSGLPVVFGGAIRHQGATVPQLVISRLIGTFGHSLRGLAVQSGRGLGGAVLRDGEPGRVNDYASTTAITHDYDRIVVGEERLTSVLAVPVVVHGAVRGVLYGAVRDPQPIGDRALQSANVVAAQLKREVEARLRPEQELSSLRAAAALADLAELIRDTSDPKLRDRLIRIHRDLGGQSGSRTETVAKLAPREVDVLRLVAVGASNLEVAARLGLSPETVKAYLRTAMRKLNVRNRTAAAHAARQAGVL